MNNYVMCQKCKKRPASVFIEKIVNGKSTKMHLCRECSSQYNVDVFDSFAGGFLDPESMFNSMLGYGGRELVSTCPTCGLSDREFIDNGYLGCPDCYKSFSAYVEKMINRVQPANHHTGRKKGDKLAISVDKAVEPEMSEIDKLKLDLKVAIKDEDYLKAASIRDQIKAIENKENK